ncbi:MAG: nitrile hydratase accessory protein [Burkholderiales bacterium PBB5]|nr:MAG: nitrile hydratase accessory protein [Burkholderiales bacterium PBB5]
MTDTTAPAIDLRSCPGLPLGHDDAPVFAEPWQAQAFAMTLALHQQGCFSWPEWAAALSAQIQAAQTAGDADDGSTYYQHWLAALEALVTAKGLGQAVELQRTAEAWAHAAERTPHGQAIVLQPADYPRA